MKIYFMVSPRELKDNPERCKMIYDSIESQGHKNVSHFVRNVNITDFYKSDIKDFYKSTIGNLKRADVCVFETSIHSLAIGQLINVALQLGKPVIALYFGENEPFFLSGAEDDKIQLIHYSLGNISKVLSDSIHYASSKQDVRFNFFISPKIVNYLDWISKVKRIPRSVYLRNLINKDIRTNEEFNNS